MQREDGYKDDSRTSKGGIVKEVESTHTTNIKHSAFWKLSDKETWQRNRKMRSTKGKWVLEEAVVPSGAVECVTCRKRMPHFESRRDARIKTRRGGDMRKR